MTDVCHRCDSAPTTLGGILCPACRAADADLGRRYHAAVIAEAEARAAGRGVRA